MKRKHEKKKKRKKKKKKKNSKFDFILKQKSNVPFDLRNIQTLLIEVFKRTNKLASPVAAMLKRRVNTYNLKNFQEFVTDRRRTFW